MERKRLIRITNNRIFLTPEMSLSLSATSLKGESIKFRTVQDIYWEIEIIEYNKEERSIKVRVVDYHPENIVSFTEQTAKSQVLYICFEPLSWRNIRQHVFMYILDKLKRQKVVVDDDYPIPASNDNSFFKASKHSSGSGIINETNTSVPYSSMSNVTNVKEVGSVYFKNTVFNIGFVSFDFKSKELKKIINLKVINDHLLSEFNVIKGYFPKALGGKKKFTIHVVFTLTNNVVTDVNTSSPEISAIDEKLIDSIKFQRTLSLISTPLRRIVDKSLFTSDDIFDSFEDNEKDGNIFKQSGEQILAFLINATEVRNAKHLQYLSGAKHSERHMLKFTLKPIFGFLFFIEGERQNHFCWELLNSHATYLWSFSKVESEFQFQYARIEKTISLVRQIGRDEYKREFKNGNIDGDLIFSVINHPDVNSSFKDGFVEWKHRLKERLV